MKKKSKRKEKIIILVCIGIYAGILLLLNKGCPTKMLLGISCPGCGMTRACLAVLRFDFKDAFFYHPLFILVPFMGIAFLWKERFPKRLLRAFWIGISIIFILVWLYRLLFWKDGIIGICFADSILGKILDKILKGLGHVKLPW